MSCTLCLKAETIRKWEMNGHKMKTHVTVARSLYVSHTLSVFCPVLHLGLGRREGEGKGEGGGSNCPNYHLL